MHENESLRRGTPVRGTFGGNVNPSAREIGSTYGGSRVSRSLQDVLPGQAKGFGPRQAEIAPGLQFR